MAPPYNQELCPEPPNVYVPIAENQPNTIITKIIANVWK